MDATPHMSEPFEQAQAFIQQFMSARGIATQKEGMRQVLQRPRSAYRILGSAAVAQAHFSKGQCLFDVTSVACSEHEMIKHFGAPIQVAQRPKNCQARFKRCDRLWPKGPVIHSQAAKRLECMRTNNWLPGTRPC
jgi:hypothetical protein